jgi:alginate O-acetyltransferase complex protein AlgI
VLFNSFEFFALFPLLFLLYWGLNNKSIAWQNGLLLLASYSFYSWWSWKFAGLLALSTILDYLYGFAVASHNRKKAKLFVWLSVINNLGILAIFKYYNFFAAQLSALMQLLGLNIPIYLLEIVLPIGISFYTFHGMSYVFDIYRGKMQPVKNIVDYGLFVSFFPLLVAGPIERATHLLPQIQSKRHFTYHQGLIAGRLIIWGLFKKVVLADSLAPFVDDCFRNYQTLDGTTLIIGSIAFSFQIYCDFSGYSDIASGVAKLLGFDIIRNFNFPYFSKNINEFWRRWHISLSSWFRDYLYIPLGGSQKGIIITLRNIFIVFLLSGLWHGSHWHFIVWGLLHAIAFVPAILMNRQSLFQSDTRHDTPSKTTTVFSIIITFAFVSLAWIFFRADNTHMALDYLQKIGSSLMHEPQQFLRIPNNIAALVFILPMILADIRLRKQTEHRLFTSKNSLLNALAYLIMFVLILYGMLNGEANNTFIYFQF